MKKFLVCLFLAFTFLIIKNNAKADIIMDDKFGYARPASCFIIVNAENYDTELVTVEGEKRVERHPLGNESCFFHNFGSRDFLLINGNRVEIPVITSAEQDELFFKIVQTSSGRTAIIKATEEDLLSPQQPIASPAEAEPKAQAKSEVKKVYSTTLPIVPRHSNGFIIVFLTLVIFVVIGIIFLTRK